MDGAPTTGVVIGMDPHKRSVTIEVMTADEVVVDRGRYGTDEAGFAALLERCRRWPERVWAVEGCNGIGRHVATRLVTAGEHVLDVPPKLSARVRTFATGQGRKTDATDAHSVALVGTRMSGLRTVVPDAQREALALVVLEEVDPVRGAAGLREPDAGGRHQPRVLTAQGLDQGLEPVPSQCGGAVPSPARTRTGTPGAGQSTALMDRSRSTRECTAARRSRATSASSALG